MCDGMVSDTEFADVCAELEVVEMERDDLRRAIEWLDSDEAGDFLEQIIDSDIADIQTALYEMLTGLV